MTEQNKSSRLAPVADKVLMKTINRIVIAFLCLASSSIFAASNTPDYYKCTNSVGGEWEYGRAPRGCDARSFGEDRVIYRDYSVLVFDDAKTRVEERRRYMAELYALVQEASVYYMKKRKPNISAQELDAWRLGIMATAAHESFATQYRVASDQRLKMMRGDSGHGHGMMQVDDRSHFPAIEQGVGWNLALHMVYAMDIYYRAWEKAPTLSCVGSATNYKSRIRAAWAQYNGGPAKGCRWTNPNDAFARNDQNFLNSLNSQRWLQFVDDPQKKTKIPIVCLIEKKENCAVDSGSGDDNEPPTLVQGQLYQLLDRRVCVYAQQKLLCLQEERDRVCLAAFGQLQIENIVSLSQDVSNSFEKQNLDRHSICQQFTPSLVSVGKLIQLEKTINLRATPGGGLLGSVPLGSVVEVKDFEVRGLSSADRYYRVKFRELQGWVYAGTKSDALLWAKEVSANLQSAEVAVARQTIEIVNSVGINFRQTPGGSLIQRIPAKTYLQVLSVVVRGSSNEIYYQVSYQGTTGFIYSGFLLPQSTVSQWTRIDR